MTGHLPRKLLLGFLVLLLITLLVCVTLQIQGPWPRGFPLKPLRFYYTGRDFNTSVDYQQPLEDELDIDEEQKPNPSAWLFHNQSQLNTDIGPAKPNLSRPELRNPTKPSGAVKPTQPDFFGDHYAEDDIPSQTTCPSSIRKRVRQTQFAQMFLQKIPVLQWAKHFSAREYQRLRRYGGAHGWGSVDAQVLKSSLQIMNTSANGLMFDDWEERKNQSQCIRCAVVGNGGILRGSRKGKEIDQHHYVFRVNGAALKGFEADVGSRTSFYTFSTNTMRNSIRSYAGVGYRGPPLSEETRFIFLPDHDRDYILMKAAATHTAIDKGPERSKSPPTFFGNDATVEKFKIYHPDFIRYLRNRFLHSNLLKTSARAIYRPSTGAVMLLAALHTCDQVDAYGFMTPDYDRYSDHYYDKQRNPVRFYANHDMRMEMRLWQQLHQAGLMTLYMRHQ